MNFKFIATIISSLIAAITWLLFANKKQEIEQLEKENEQKNEVIKNNETASQIRAKNSKRSKSELIDGM